MKDEKLREILKEQDKALNEMDEKLRHSRRRSNNLLKSIYLTIGLIQEYVKSKDELDEVTEEFLEKIFFVYQTSLSDNSIDEICEVEDYIDGFIYSKLFMTDETFELDDIQINTIHKGEFHVPDEMLNFFEGFLEELKKKTEDNDDSER